MSKVNIGVFVAALFGLAACVTINVYFPAAAAERAAEQFVDDVLGETDRDSSYRIPLEPSEKIVWLASMALVDFVVSDAEAQEPEININTPQINSIKARMAQRQRTQLAPLFDSGAIGFSNDGFVEIRDRSAVSLSERRNLESLVAEENRDRSTVYREIAVANGHPEWEDEIQRTFAEEWISNARSGWYYQDANGNWRQK